MVGPPHLLDVVEGADFRAEDMDDHIAGIDQDPVGGPKALDADVAPAGLFQVLDQTIGDGRYVPVRTAGGHHHVVADRRLAVEVYGNRILGFGLVKAREDHIQGVRR